MITVSYPVYMIITHALQGVLGWCAVNVAAGITSRAVLRHILGRKRGRD